ncbi:MAG: PAS domain-containing protein, partial [Betaproteobacteria bacterium]|nr:PAS domain-containing protein [Betaproteobacteria bacterium]
DLPMALLDASAGDRPIVQVNRAFLDYFALSEAETLASSLSRLILHDDKVAEGRLFAGSSPARVRLRTTRKDGVSLFIEILANPLRDSAGKQTHWLVTFIDRSETEQLHAELARIKNGAAS